ncbi:MAG: DUF3054 domain-containing protein, partial [Cellulomonadaceae bacterium]
MGLDPFGGADAGCPTLCVRGDSVAPMNDVLSRPLPPARVRARVIVTAAALDVAVVIAFAASGRASHDEAVDAVGVAHTAWP